MATLSRLPAALGLHACESACDDESDDEAHAAAPVALEGRALPRESVLRLGVLREDGDEAHVAIILYGTPQAPARDSYQSALTLLGRLRSVEGVRDPELIASVEATEALRERREREARLAAERRPLEGLSDDERDALAVGILCREWGSSTGPLGYDDRLRRIVEEHPVLRHTPFPGVLGMASPDARVELATAVARHAGLEEECATFLEDLAAAAVR